ncbi:MAG: AEC family transporter [Kiritimatiellae bacterium]|nr:AEC family transporter [Kiritimatiellia bacterium]
MENLFAVAVQVGVLFALMAVGFVCRKRRLLNDVCVKGIVDLLVLVVTPALVLHAFERPFAPSMLRGLGFAALFAFAGHLAAIAFVTVFLRHRDTAKQNVLRVAAVFSNAGFMGVPLEQALLGDVGVFYGVVYVGIFNLVIWSWGYCTMRGVSMRTLTGSSAKLMFINPGTVGIALGLPLFFSSFTLPTVLHVPVKCLADLNTPLAMIVIGYYLAGAKPGAMFRLPHAYVAAVFRLVAYPLLMIGALVVFRNPLALDPTMMLALVVSASAPVAAMTSMLAAKYGSDVELSVGLVSGTTLLSILTMPAVISFAMSVFGM